MRRIAKQLSVFANRAAQLQTKPRDDFPAVFNCRKKSAPDILRVVEARILKYGRISMRQTSLYRRRLKAAKAKANAPNAAA